MSIQAQHLVDVVFSWKTLDSGVLKWLAGTHRLELRQSSWGVVMKSNKLILKCYLEQEEGSWVAVCLDFNLAAQAESERSAKKKLEAMIQSYVTEALTVDREYADQLLTRRAPLHMWIRYYWISVMSAIRKNKRSVFSEVMPLRPA